MSIKNIIFDFGGVLFNINYKLTEQALTALLEPTFTLKNPVGLKRTLKQYETGKINTETFIWNIQKHCAPSVQGRDVMKAWNSMLLSMPKERFEFVKKLRKKYKVYLLSNINEMHANWVDRYLKKNYGLENWQEDYFDKIYYSHEIHMRKPTKSIYKYIMRDAKLKGSESLFIDDLEENVLAAQAVGLNAVQHNPKDEIIKKFDSYLKTIR